MLVVLMGFAALTVDLGAMYNTRGDLQRSADAAALAGASTFITDDMMRVRVGSGDSATLAAVTSLANARVTDFAARNLTFGASSTAIDAGDIQTGWVDLYSAITPFNPAPAPAAYNAVSVTVRRDETGANGPVQFYFAPIFGRLVGESSATAVAVFDDRASGINTNVPGTDMLPFTVHEDAFLQDFTNGNDDYAYNSSGDTIDSAPDGIREIRIYPYPLSGGSYTEGDGSFGMLNIGTHSQGATYESEQVMNGVTPADFEAEIGTSELSFIDEYGNPTTYDVTGSPGMTTSIKTALDTQVGNIVGFFLHTNVVLSGSNAVFTITQLRYGRVMAQKLTGPPSARGFYIQPVAYSGAEVRIDPGAPSTGGLVGRIVLAR